MLNKSKISEPKKQIFYEFIEEWFKNDYQKKKVSNNTLIKTQCIINKHLVRENPFASKEIDTITANDIDEFIELKMNSTYSSNYVRKIHNILNQSFSYAYKLGRIKLNPAKIVNIPVIESKPPIVWSYNEIKEFLRICKEEGHYYLVFFLAIYTGLGKNELFALRWSDIDFNEGKINVKQTLKVMPNGEYLILSLKTNRIIPIPKFIIQELKMYKKQQEEWIEHYDGLYNNQDLINCTITGEIVNPQNIDSYMKSILKSLK